MNAMAGLPLKRVETHKIETHLGPLAVHERGQGRVPILLWPSIFTDHRIFDRLVQTLGPRFRFFLIDGPGHGESDGTESEFSMQDCAAALGQIMDAIGLERAIVGGTSWGGLVGAEFAIGHPDRVAALVLMNTPMEIDARRPSLSSRLISFGAGWGLGTALFRNGIARSFFRPESFSENPAYAQAFHAMLTAADPKRLAPAIRSVILRSAPLLDRIDAITAPTLIIAGEEDAMYPLDVQAEAALRMPKGQFVPVPGKHISVVDAPAETAAAVDAFLRGVSLR